MSDYPQCTEKCAAMPYCVECGRKKHPRGRDPGVYASSGYCEFECPGRNKEPEAGHLWPNEWWEELEQRAAETKPNE
jgi:hypothetical protein